MVLLSSPEFNYVIIQSHEYRVIIPFKYKVAIAHKIRLQYNVHFYGHKIALQSNKKSSKFQEFL